MAAMSEKKEIRLTVRLHNNRLKSAREEMGLSQRELAEGAGVSVGTYQSFENMRLSPLSRKDGSWLNTALKVSVFMGVGPSYLFPEVLENVRANKIERELGMQDIMQLIGSSQRELLLGEGPPSPEEVFEKKELKQKISEMLEDLKPEEAELLMDRYGLDGREPRGYKEIGEECGVTGTTISSRERALFRRLKLGQARMLRSYHDDSLFDERKSRGEVRFYERLREPPVVTTTYHERDDTQEAIHAIRMVDSTSDFSSLQRHVVRLRADYTRALRCFGVDGSPHRQHLVYVDSRGILDIRTLCCLQIGRFIQMNNRCTLPRCRKCDILRGMSGVKLWKSVGRNETVVMDARPCDHVPREKRVYLEDEN